MTGVEKSKRIAPPGKGKGGRFQIVLCKIMRVFDMDATHSVNFKATNEELLEIKDFEKTNMYISNDIPDDGCREKVKKYPPGSSLGKKEY